MNRGKIKILVNRLIDEEQKVTLLIRLEQKIKKNRDDYHLLTNLAHCYQYFIEKYDIQRDPMKLYFIDKMQNLSIKYLKEKATQAHHLSKRDK